MRPYRIIVAGGRHYDSRETVWRFLSHYTLGIPRHDIEIVSGLAQGPDTFGKEWAEQVVGCPVAEFPADWVNIEAPGAVVRKRRDGKLYNVIAGHWRNQQMADYATHLVAFWDGESTGTKDMIDRAEKAGLVVRIVNYKTMKADKTIFKGE